jgi:RimJ/RimL family protein N-acetyltransferase
MPILDLAQYPLAQALFAPFLPYHLCVQAVLGGTHPGLVWVDNLAHPRVGFAYGSEGQYLAGDLGFEPAYAELRELILPHSSLMVEPAGWEPVLPRVWKNVAARRHCRKHFVYRRAEAPTWRDRLPEGVRAVSIDAAFLQQEDLENFSLVKGWIGDWYSPEYFIEHGGGTCLLIGDTIASWSLTDCAIGERCEIGIVTDRRFRRRGLATLAASATVEACLKKGYPEIGWQCLSSNTGSIATARRIGFEEERDYTAFSGWLPAENPGDMTPEEYSDWAQHYERVGQAEVGWLFQAAQAWTMAGDPRRALQNLEALHRAGWKARREWLEHNWRFDPLRELVGFEALSQALVMEI